MSAAGDGRNIDLGTGSLTGEAADQEVPDVRAFQEGAVPFEVWQRPASTAPGDGTYYDRPVLKEPVWIWAVPAYFYAGGAAGAAATLGAACQLVDREAFDGIVQRSRWIAAVGGAIGTALLIYDLGRPERFINMLRVFRPTSPLNVGSWFLSAHSSLSSIAALLGRRAPRLADAAGMLAGTTGMPMSGYTAVLLSNTAIPIWQGSRMVLPVLFVASAASSAAALLEMANLDEAETKVVESFGKLAKFAELAAALGVKKEAGQVERVAEPLQGGVSGVLWAAGKALVAASLVASIAPGRSRAKRIVSGSLGTAGALATRWAIFEAGKRSARDPKALFEAQRSSGSSEA